jgi:signal transduction histidine kinase
MMNFAFGLLVGGMGVMLVAIAVAGWAYRRFVLLERRARQAERLAELGTLTGGLAHEIKNPLSTVQLNLQLLEEDLRADHPGQTRVLKRLATVRNETARLRDILDDFLRYAGRLELNCRPTDLNHLLEELVDFFAPQAQVQRVQIRLRKSPEPVIASIDPKLIKQALLNLMLNGVHAMPGGGDLLLSVSTNGSGHAVIDVIDTGPGIPTDAATKVFEAYYSTKRGGTGLGLPMSKRIAQEHAGDLSVTSEPGKGSDFRLTLPLTWRPDPSAERPRPCPGTTPHR